jgi:hypothetical protein
MFQVLLHVERWTSFLSVFELLCRFFGMTTLADGTFGRQATVFMVIYSIGFQLQIVLYFFVISSVPLYRVVCNSLWRFLNTGRNLISFYCYVLLHTAIYLKKNHVSRVLALLQTFYNSCSTV